LEYSLNLQDWFEVSLLDALIVPIDEDTEQVTKRLPLGSHPFLQFRLVVDRG
jgi:hypothetical protein